MRYLAVRQQKFYYKNSWLGAISKIHPSVQVFTSTVGNKSSASLIDQIKVQVHTHSIMVLMNFVDKLLLILLTLHKTQQKIINKQCGY